MTTCATCIYRNPGTNRRCPDAEPCDTCEGGEDYEEDTDT